MKTTTIVPRPPVAVMTAVPFWRAVVAHAAVTAVFTAADSPATHNPVGAAATAKRSTYQVASHASSPPV